VKRLSAAALFLVSIAAGVWLFSPGPVSRPNPDPCAGRKGIGECAIDEVAPEAAASPAPAPDVPSVPKPTPQPAVPVAKSAPPPAVSAADLRDQADRLLQDGKIREGLDALRRATDADPSARNHGDLGNLLLKLTAVDEALINLRKAAELDPSNPDRWLDLANAYYRQPDLGEAWNAERKAREAEPGLRLGWDSEGRRIRRDDTGTGTE
jgi:tetratricopeptide (TPR) repeat protein